MDIAIVVLLVVLVGLVLWDLWRRERRWREQGDVLAKAVGERLDGTVRVFGDVKRELGELSLRAKEIHEVGKDISSLQDILRAPKLRGGLGELLLERLLADCLPRDNYYLQYRFRNGETVDAVVRIGGNLVPVDSKFPLEDFERVVGAESEIEQVALRRQFNRSLKKHVDAVAKYIQPDENTFDFALMYIPAENVYYETILRAGNGEDDICSYCLRRKVIPVSPNSFYAYLQAIVLGLRGLRVEKTARDIIGQLGRLQNDLDDFQRDYEVMGGHIRNTAKKYDEASSKLIKLGDRLQLAGREPAAELEKENPPGADDNEK